MPSIRNLLAYGLLSRLCLILYGGWQDNHFKVKFTDVDYHVFTDAANYTLNGHSPYERATYRYTPIIAWLLMPCHIVHIVWGKGLFVLVDLIVAKLIVQILEIYAVDEKAIKVAVCSWLFNPIIMTVSCRGNAESIISMSVIATVYCLLKKNVILSGLIFGFSIHLKVFPVVNALAFFLYLRNTEVSVIKRDSLLSKLMKLCKSIFQRDVLLFFLSAAAFLVLITTVCYAHYGVEFLNHAYLYHVTRKDIRHNFSIYFYMLYTNSQWWLGLVCFLTQLIVIVCLSINLHKDIIFSNFMITYAFVTFNKICTSQYFLWYLTFLPFLVPGMRHVRLREIVTAIFVWTGAQSLWLSAAYRLEFEGESIFEYVWYSSVIFFWVNIFIMLWFLKRYKPVFRLMDDMYRNKKND